MAAPPDVVALPLEEALAALQKAGWQVRVRTTSPPRSAPGGGVQRVVRQRATAANEVELVVAWERYAPAPRASAGPRSLEGGRPQPTDRP
ncbi:MAG: PASTA domain-containing protein [Armatimonadota bacterium]|nr:PASTA domain-containing protein [Armatimonadota bacterium]MDW8156287.1 PASTA domain-containing protein [Armatimonadota bacterium]